VSPTPSPDGKSIIYAIPNGGLYRVDTTGENKTALGVTDKQVFQFPTDWSGDFLLFSMTGEETKSDLWSLRVSADGRAAPGAKPEPYLETPARELYARFAPGHNQHWLAYQSDGDRRNEVYVDRFPEKGRRVKISTQGGQFPVWGPGGRELFYMSPDSKVMVVTITYGQDSVSASAPQEVFSIPPSAVAVAPPFDTLDGERFVVLAPVIPANHALEFIENWTALLKH
jgi:Tol biopolymer transport system component